MKKTLISLIGFFLLCVALLCLNVRGEWGNPTVDEIKVTTKIPGSAFESSLARGRFAQTMALVEDKRADLVNGKDVIATPDVGIVSGRAYPLFAPGLAFYSVPAYILGSIVGASQLGVFIFGIISAAAAATIIVVLAKNLGSPAWAAWFAGFAFLFGTTAFPYSISLAQHNFTVLFLLTILLAGFHGNKHGWLYALGWISYGLAIFMDYPNLVLLAPAIIFMVLQSLQLKITSLNTIKVKLRLALIFGSIFFAIISGIHAYYNFKHFGSPTSIGPAVYTSRANKEEDIDLLRTSSLVTQEEERSVTESLFALSDVPKGMEVLLVSKGRGVIYFAPVMLIGFIGIFHLLRGKHLRFGITALMLISVNLILYSSFSDPWGGWVYGPRYLIISFSLLAIGLGISLGRVKHPLFHLSVLGLFAYSLFVNLLGVLTTSQLPAEIEAIPLNLPYTFDYNFDLLLNGMNSSFIYRTFFANNLISTEYFILVYAFIFFPAAVCLLVAPYLGHLKSIKLPHLNFSKFLTAPARLLSFSKKVARL